jgi:hypothetical protein
MRLLDKLTLILQEMVIQSVDFEPKHKKDMVARVIRINDLTKVATEFESFKQKVIEVMDPTFSAKIDSEFDEYLRKILQNINDMCEIVGLFILKSDIQHDYLIYFFTQKWVDA